MFEANVGILKCEIRLLLFFESHVREHKNAAIYPIAAQIWLLYV
jgi:hypothetical protein